MFLKIKVYFAIFIVALIIIFISLGIWQINRSSQKQDYLNNNQQYEKLPPINIGIDNIDKIKSFYFRKVLVTGTFLDKYQLIYDNQTNNNMVGYYVLTPFKIQNSNKYLLVNRGFKSWSSSGNRKVANIDVTEKLSTIIVRLKPIVKRFVLQSDNIKEKKFPIIIQNINLTKIAIKTNIYFIDALALLAPEQKNGFARSWHTKISITPEKHIAYAVQWFLLAIVAFIGGLVFLFHPKYKNEK